MTFTADLTNLKTKRPVEAAIAELENDFKIIE